VVTQGCNEAGDTRRQGTGRLTAVRDTVVRDPAGPPAARLVRAAAVPACLSAVLLAACGSAPASSSGPPAWMQRIGSGVSIAAPPGGQLGEATPGAAVEGMMTALNAGKPAQACSFLLPAAQAQCSQAVSAAPAGSIPTVRGMAIGYVAVDGARALVGTTGTYCAPSDSVGGSSCFANRDPAAIFSTARPFGDLWSETIEAENDRPAYSLTPCEKVSGKWYADALPGAGGI
jgi:hypothetical protein